MNSRLTLHRCTVILAVMLSEILHFFISPSQNKICAHCDNSHAPSKSPNATYPVACAVMQSPG